MLSNNSFLKIKTIRFTFVANIIILVILIRFCRRCLETFYILCMTQTRKTVKLLNCMFYIHTYFWFAVDEMSYLYKFSRDVYFADAINSAFLRFYFRGSQDFVLVDFVCTIIKYKFSRT